MKRLKLPSSANKEGLSRFTQASLMWGGARGRVSRGRPWAFLALWTALDLLWGVAAYG